MIAFSVRMALFLALAFASPNTLAQTHAEPSDRQAEAASPPSGIEQETAEALEEVLNSDEAAALEAVTSEAQDPDDSASEEVTVAEQEAAEVAEESGAVVEDIDALRWGGAWRSFWRDGQALLTITQQGSNVVGTYQPGDGTIEGSVDGVMLTGTWRQPGSSGRFEFAMAPDGSSYVGRFATGEYWNGVRLMDGFLSATLFGRHDAQSAFSSFISAGNAAREGDPLAEILLRRYATFADDEDMSARAANWRLAHLNELLNVSTFRVNRVTPSDDPSKATIKLDIAGTSFDYTITIIEVKTDEWAVVVPTHAALEAIENAVMRVTETPSLEELAAVRHDNPRQTLRDFVTGTSNWNNGGKALVLSTMDLSDIPATLRDTDGPIAAEFIRQIINRLGQPLWQEIPDDPDRRRPLKVYENSGGELLIAVTPHNDGTRRWLFTAESLHAAPAIFQVMQNLPLADGVRASEPFTDAFRRRTLIRNLSPSLLNRVFLLENWQWLALGAALVVGLVGAIVLAAIIRLLALAAMSLAGSSPDFRSDVSKIMRWPLWLFFLGIALFFELRKIGLRQDISEIANMITGTVLIIAGTFVAYYIVRAIAAALARHARETDGSADDIAVILGGGLAKVAVLVGGVLLLSELYELPYEGVIAALGVGGLALGFAARDAVANFISAGILMADRPFKKGDVVDVGGVRGTVEDVGMRSTRLRTIDDTVVVLPNAQISEGQVNNFGQRRRRRVTMTLGMTYGTPRKKLQAFIDRLRVMMEADPDVLPDPRINFDNFGAYSIDISIIAYLKSPDLDTYLLNKHQLIGNIIDLAAELGVEFAFPTQTVHVAKTAPRAVATAAE